MDGPMSSLKMRHEGTHAHGDVIIVIETRASMETRRPSLLAVPREGNGRISNGGLPMGDATSGLFLGAGLPWVMQVLGPFRRCPPFGDASAGLPFDDACWSPLYCAELANGLVGCRLARAMGTGRRLEY
ncbi:unnamed protein product [Ilex paraguariensis]|uniref:Uncharacterized protein n=1 Tax=Ilex paraguariensis TaxID=185542 RepID=A0ABC8V0D5_9AQUA